MAGCESKSFLNPGELVDPDSSNQLRGDGTVRPRIQNILSELDLGVTPVADAFTQARDVAAQDLLVNAQDYRIGPSDLVQLSITDPGEAQPSFVQPLRVSETGRITLPDIRGDERLVQVDGLTEQEAVGRIEQAYIEAGMYTVPPKVSLIVVEPNSKVYNINGNVAAPGRYVLTKADFRMLDAFTNARGTADPEYSSEYVYVIRSLQRSQPVPQVPVRPGTQQQGDPLDPNQPGSSVEEEDWPFDQPTFASAQGQPAGNQPGGFQFQAPPEPTDWEIIRVPLQELLRGQLKYNIVIRPEDTIIVPPPVTGEFFVGGHVVQPGVFSILPGRQITMKQAIVSARMLDEVAIPGRTQLIRRVNDQDVFVRVDLAKVFVGEEPDIYLQPDDMILVGTNAVAPFLAAFRNGFRVSYGFGFLYDRNFAYDRDDGPFGF